MSDRSHDHNTSQPSHADEYASSCDRTCSRTHESRRDQHDSRNGYPGRSEMQQKRALVRACRGYLSDYDRLLRAKLTYFSDLPEQHQSYVSEAFLERLRLCRRGAVQNAQFLGQVLRNDEHSTLKLTRLDDDAGNEDEGLELGHSCMEANLSRVRRVFQQIYREWTQHGAQERDRTFAPILKDLENEYDQYQLTILHEDAQATKIQRHEYRVLCPGCGLGRLPLEIRGLGMSVQGNESSALHLMISSFLLNQNYSQAPESAVQRHEIFPFVMSSNNIRRAENQLLSCIVPDVDPREFAYASGCGEFSICAGTFLDSYSGMTNENAWHAVVTCFFIDTAQNVIDYVERIYALLVEGGSWINVGPLLYHYADSLDIPSIELTLEELVAVITQVGFEFVGHISYVQSAYASDTNSMLRDVYDCAHFVCRKPRRTGMK